MKRPLPGLGGELAPERPVIEVHPDMPGVAGSVARNVEAAVKHELIAATKRFCRKAKKISAFSFVIFGLKSWWDELRELNPAATADYFRAMGDLAEPDAPDEARTNAEERRKSALAAIRTSLQQTMQRERGG